MLTERERERDGVNRMMDHLMYSESRSKSGRRRRRDATRRNARKEASDSHQEKFITLGEFSTGPGTWSPEAFKYLMEFSCFFLFLFPLKFDIYSFLSWDDEYDGKEENKKEKKRRRWSSRGMCQMIPSLALAPQEPVALLYKLFFFSPLSLS